MQDLMVIKGERVIVQTSNKVYEDSLENFILDGGENLPDDVESLDYNKTVKSCWINDVAFQKFPNEYAERVLASIAELVSNKENREHEQALEQEAEQLANMTQEEKDSLALFLAKEERAQAVSNITVEVDGMVFDGNEASQSRMGRTIAAAVALGLDLTKEKRTWVLADNTIVEVTIAQLAQVLKLAGDAQTALWVVPYATNET